MLSNGSRNENELPKSRIPSRDSMLTPQQQYPSPPCLPSQFYSSLIQQKQEEEQEE
jgi:hypothetical protein